MENVIFFNYSRENTRLAKELKRDLEEERYCCWIDQSDIQAGAKWEQSMVLSQSFQKN